MRTTCHVICALLVLVAVFVVDSAVASPALMHADTTIFRGGCSQKYCANFRCGPATEACKHNASNGCDPTIPSIACDNHECGNITVKACYSLSGTQTCTWDDLRNCGTSAYRADCWCNASHVCKLLAKTSDYVYWHCP